MKQTLHNSYYFTSQNILQMKKQILTVATILVTTFSLNAQSLNPANLSKSAKLLTKKTSSKSNTNFEAQGQSISMRQDVASTLTYDITATTPLGATTDIRITAMKIESEAMGQEMSFDSQNPDDGNAEIGAEVKKIMKNVIKVTTDDKAIITAIKGNEKLGTMGKSMNGSLSKGEILDVFLKLNKSVNVNDSWTDSTDTKESKVVNTYTYKSFENGMATIELLAKMKVDSKAENMGMTVYSKLEGKIVSTLTVDPKTLIIKKTESTTLMSGTAEAQGQTSPISVFTTTTTSVE
jgi:Family of unknown function (DUF6263)